ncbi:major facilitator superfamily domain-containing protein [Xylaria bambusicola]|uniref:major facilitator superfamily domain-containing protein n=1 Tax=Xylaria bambusicola TaxID=326684 RepID=UPI002007669E|nr:major facilitator superfamily domain-containing protein [Xylaria bambusicola]KAI0518585.1 major facilitator superfamily domain-containing protein [Xylaria bambusicola]
MTHMEDTRSDLKHEGDQAAMSASREDVESHSDETIELGPTRSQNGHGCADISDKDDEGDPFEVSFDSDEDPLCPRSMNIARKWLLVCIVGLGSLCVTATSSIYTATYAQMNPEFHQSEIVATLGLSTFVLGIALGPLFLGPLSEFYGRRPIYLASWTMFVIWLIPSAVAHNTATIVTTRFIDGFTGSAFLSVAGGTVSDVFRRDQIQGPMTIISLSPFIGPSLGPLVGGFINYYTNWRWTYYVLIIWAAALLVLMVFCAPETYHPIKLREKARLMRKETGDERWKAPMEKSTKSIPRTVGLSLLRPFQLLLLEPMCLLLSLLSAVLLGVIYLFFGAFPLVFGNTYGFNLWQVGLSFLGIFVGMLVGAATNPIWRSIHRRLVRKNHGVPEPEFHLASSILGAVIVPIGLFWFAWTSLSHWILPIIGSGIFGCGTLLVFNGIFTFLVGTYPLYAASALAANSFLRCTFAAAFPLFGRQLYEAAGYQWASSVLAFITLALMPLPYVFFHFGKRLRDRSRFTATSV